MFHIAAGGSDAVERFFGTGHGHVENAEGFVGLAGTDFFPGGLEDRIGFAEFFARQGESPLDSALLVAMQGNAGIVTEFAHRLASQLRKDDNINTEPFGLVNGHDADRAGRFIFFAGAVLEGADKTGPIPCPAAGGIKSGGRGRESVKFVRRDDAGSDSSMDPSANNGRKPGSGTKARGGGEGGDIRSYDKSPRRGQDMVAGNEVRRRGDEADE